MQIGLMNNPREDPLAEIRWIGGHGFDFVDLTLEHPRAHRVDAAAVRRALDEWNLSVVGHTGSEAALRLSPGGRAAGLPG